MKLYQEAAMEKAMKIHEVILRAIDKKITWLQAAEIIRVSPRQLRRWRTGWEKLGYDGLFDRRRGKPSPKRVALETVAEVLRLYQEKYDGFSVQHFHEKLGEEHKIVLSYTWVKKALQGAGLIEEGSEARSASEETGATTDPRATVTHRRQQASIKAERLEVPNRILEHHVLEMIDGDAERVWNPGKSSQTIYLWY